MSEVRVRSKTGCLTCKNRRKKCDEIRPVCQRCKRAGMECLGYDHLDNPVLRPRNPRFKRQSPAESEPPLVAGPSLEDVAGSSASAFLGSFPEYLAPNIQQSHLALPGETWSFPAPNLFDERRLGSGLATSLNKSSNVPLLSGQPPSTQLDGLDVWWNAGLGPSDQSLGVPQLLEPTLNHQPDIYLHSDVGLPSHSYSAIEGTDLVQTFLGLGDSQTSTGASSSAVSQLSPSFQGSALPSPTLERDDSPSIMDEDSDTEGVMAILGPALALDRNVPSNALPFIISSYLRWAIRTMFEPRKVAQRTRDHLIKRFIRSDESRSGTTLVATIMESRLRDAAISASHSPEVKILEGRVYRKLAMIKSSQEPLPDSHASDVLAVLHGLYDMIAVVCQARPLSHFMRLLREITPVYRMACSEPIGAPIHLQAKLLHPESVLRHFPVIDIMMSLTSGRPTFLRYDVTDIPEFYEQANQIANFGMQWMYGVPDQFLIMLARMHMLRDNFAPNVDPQVVKEFETEIENFKPALDESPDSYLKVARLTVQEGWRQTMYIYLYMGLCGVASNDLRVQRALKRFIRLLDGVKPGRIPDSFLVVPMTSIGVAAHKPRDRDIIRRRMLGVHECSQANTSGNDAVLMLNEVWATSDAQSRPAIWSDLRVACSMVTGIT